MSSSTANNASHHTTATTNTSTQNNNIKNNNTNNTNEHQPHSTENLNKNVDYDEVGKFTKLAEQWWDKQGAFATLHHINPLRLNWIEQNVQAGLGETLTGLKVVDIGCGGGILTESMARRGANAIGIDLGEANLKAASVHAGQSGLEHTLAYEHIAAEAFAKKHGGEFDVVTCMEMLEHVPDPAAIVNACFDLLKPGGVCVLSTINRNPKSYLFAIIGAEYVLRLIDKGTHDYAKFITPAELDKMAVSAGFTRQDLIGLHYNPITKRYWLAQNVDVNYMMAVKKPL